MNGIICPVSISLILLLLLFTYMIPVSASTPVKVLPPGDSPYGMTYADHAKNYWKWFLSIPAKDSPTDDPTGEKCKIGQEDTNSSVFYLSHTTGRAEKTCFVTAGKGLLIPIMVVEVSDKEAKGTVEELAAAADRDQDSVKTLYLKVGDQEYFYKDLIEYRTPTGPFEVVFPNNGVYGVVEGGPSTTVADGFYLLTDPLPKGNTTVSFKSSLSCLEVGCIQANYAQDVKYTIVAE